MKGSKGKCSCGKASCPQCGKTKRMAEGGRVEKEKIYRQGLADPRRGGERAVGLLNRVASGNKDAPVRRYDDDPSTMRKNRGRGG